MEQPAMTLVWILLATFFGGVLSAALASLFLLLSESRRAWLLPHLISFATGAMLAAALIDLLPEAIASVGPQRIQAITAHEIPQELGDLAVLLHAGMGPVRAMWFNAASSMTSILGGLLGYLALR